MVTIVPTLDTVTNDTVPVTTAVTVPVATTIKPVAVAVRPELAVVNAAPETLTVPETTAETDKPGTTETTWVPSIVTIVPTVETVTSETVPDATTLSDVPVTDITLLTEIVPVAMFDTLTTPVTTAVTVPVATTISPVAVAVRPLLAVVNAACETLIVPETPIG